MTTAGGRDRASPHEAGAQRAAGERTRRARRLGLLVGYAAATALAFPHPVGDTVVDLGLVLAWASPALLILTVDGLAPARAARWGFGASLAAHSLVLHWIYVVTVRFGHAPPAVGVLAPVALAAYVALFGAAFGAGHAWLARRGAAGPLAVALLWTVLDHVRSFALSGFPWATLGYAQHANAALRGLAPFTGVYGLSFAAALGGAALAAWVRDRGAGRGLGRGPARALAAVGVLHVLGAGASWLAPESDGRTLRVGILQGNVDQGIKWDLARLEQTVQIYEALAGQAADAGAEVIVLPETALPVALNRAPGLEARMAHLARSQGVGLVVGAVGVDGRGEAIRYYDSAFLVDADGRFVDRYDKAHLVPFGEYVPLRDLIGRFFAAVARGIAPDNVTAGPGPRAVRLGTAPGEARTVHAGTPICYELLFPDLVRRFVRDGASVLFAITNDAWYGRTGAPYQFLAITALRSAESRVATARAANTGVSAVIDARGRVVERTRIFERDWIVADVALRAPDAPATFYTRHGDVFARGAWIALAALAAAAVLRARGRRASGGTRA